MFSTYDSGISQSKKFDNAINIFKTPQISTALPSNNITAIKIKSPYVKESFKNNKHKNSSDFYKHPHLIEYTPYVDKFERFSYSSLSNASLLKTNEHFNSSLLTSSSLVPFFGPRLTQDMSGTKMPNDLRKNNYKQVSLFTGVNDYTFQRKIDSPDNFFKPVESKEKFKLTSSGKGTESTCMMNIDLDRYKMDLTKKDDCFDRTQVGPSLKRDPNIPASDGFQSFYRYIDDDVNRRYSYGLQMLENLKIMDVPTFPKLPVPKSSSMPQDDTIISKPRIFDGAIDLDKARFF